jgi:hypothetical protein
MAAAISGITPAKGSAFGGQVVTITGTGFGTSGTVTVDGIPVSVVWSATSIQAIIPPRNHGNGIEFTGGAVAVVVTAQDASTATTSYEYAKTRVEMALDSMASRLAECTAQKGYNFTIGAAQVRAMEEDQTVDTGAGFPQVIVYTDGGATITDEPFDFTKDAVEVIVQAVMPCDNPQTWRNQAMALLSDIRRAVMRDRSNGGTCNTTTTRDFEIAKITDNAGGAIAGASMRFEIEVPSANNDMTTSTTFDSLIQ